MKTGAVYGPVIEYQFRQSNTKGHFKRQLGKFFFKFYFVDYATTVVPISPPQGPSTQQPPLPQAILTPLFVSMGYAYKFFGFSISSAVAITMTIL